jgi:hypothetical protein
MRAWIIKLVAYLFHLDITVHKTGVPDLPPSTKP